MVEGSWYVRGLVKFQLLLLFRLRLLGNYLNQKPFVINYEGELQADISVWLEPPVNLVLTVMAAGGLLL